MLKRQCAAISAKRELLSRRATARSRAAGLKSPGGCLIHGGAKRWCARLSRRTAPTTCNEALLRAGVELAAGQNALFTLHASEMDYEMKYFAERGETPTRYLKRIGAVNERLLAGHCIHLTTDDIEILAEETRRLRTAWAANAESGQRRGPDGGGGARGRSFRPWYGRPVLRQHAPACLTRCACLRMRIRRRTATARFSRQKKLCARRRGAARQLSRREPTGFPSRSAGGYGAGQRGCAAHVSGL